MGESASIANKALAPTSKLAGGRVKSEVFYVNGLVASEALSPTSKTRGGPSRYRRGNV